MCNKAYAVHFQNEYIVHNPYLATLHELHLALVAHGINVEADAGADGYMPRLGEETNVERHTCHVACCLRRIEAGDTLSRARVVPLPLFHEAAKFGVGLCYAHFLNFEL